MQGNSVIAGRVMTWNLQRHLAVYSGLLNGSALEEKLPNVRNRTWNMLMSLLIERTARLSGIQVIPA